MQVRSDTSQITFVQRRGALRSALEATPQLFVLRERFRELLDPLLEGMALALDRLATAKHDCRQHDKEGKCEGRDRQPSVHTRLIETLLKLIGDLVEFRHGNHLPGPRLQYGIVDHKRR
ncbi:hypothetical protein D9M72_634890 [compost metagenome]